MKKITSVFLAVVIVLTLCSCSLIENADGFIKGFRDNISEFKDKASGFLENVFSKEYDDSDVNSDIDVNITEFSTDLNEIPEIVIPDYLKTETNDKAGEHTLVFEGAYLVQDDGNVIPEEILRIYYLFTNCKQYDTSFSDEVSLKAWQDGKELLQTESYIANDLSDNLRNLHPGITNRICAEFVFDPEGGNIDVFAYDLFGLEATYSHNVIESDKIETELPGKYERTLIDEPIWTNSCEWEGYVANWYISVDRAEYETDYLGNDAFRVYVYATNNADEEQFFCDLQYRAYQDGIQCEQTWAEESVESDDNLYGPTQPGQTELKSFVCAFDSESPVEVIISEYYSGDCVGGVFK